MNNNKILVELLVPDLDAKYNVFLPVNKRISNIINLLIKAINDLSGKNIDNNVCLYNKDTGLKYEENLTILDTDIRNGSTIILL